MLYNLLFFAQRILLCASVGDTKRKTEEFRTLHI